MSELKNQSEIWQWFYDTYPEYRLPPVKGKPRSLLIHNFLNPRSVVEGAQLNGAGLCKGFPDMSLFVPRGKYHGLHLELKVEGEKPKKEQREVLIALNKQGYFTEWADSVEKAKRILSSYMEIPVN